MSEDAAPLYTEDPAAITDRNPAGIVPSQKLRDESERQDYWSHAIEYGLQYYVAGRFATAHAFMPVSANILHHGVELLLKACLSRNDSIKAIRAYGHNITKLWLEFKARQQTPPPAEFDGIVERLHAFEEIRYPETLIRQGARISMGIFDVENPLEGNDLVPERPYVLMLPQIDRLMGILFAASGANPPSFLQQFENDKQALIYYNMIRGKLFDRRPIDAEAQRPAAP